MNGERNIDIIENSMVFDEGKPHIVVRNEIHHGKVLSHSHTFFEFVYVDKGFSLHSFNGKMTILTSGDLFAITPYNTHSYFSAYQADIYNCLFNIEEFSGLKEQILKLPGMDFISDPADPADFIKSADFAVKNVEFPLVKVDLNDRQDFMLLLEKIIWERANMRGGWELAVKSYLLQLIVAFSRLMQNKKDRQKNHSDYSLSGATDEYFGYVYRALEYIENNYQKNITSADIAGHIGLSSGYLAKQFKSRLYMTPAAYIRKFRIAKAMELLKTTNKSIKEIADMTGYGDISLFSRIFRQTTGKSPMGFKKLNKE
jgi:AraC-like DNA-binding protein